MPRYKLIEAREKAELSPSELARRIRCERKAVNLWERGEAEPRMEYRSAIRRELNNNDADLFKNYPEGEYPDSVSPSVDNCQQVTTNQQMSPTCQEEANRAILNSAGPNPFTILGSVRGFKELMEMLRRQFIEALAQLGWTSSFGHLSIGLVSSPSVDPEEYLALCGESVGTWWQWLNQGNYPKLERVLYANAPILKRLANTISPFQGIAANLAVQAKIMQIILDMHKLDFVARETHCAEAVHFGRLSGNPLSLATALFWQGTTYISCYHQPETAIPILHDALSCIGDNALLSRSTIYSGLSIAYAQDHTKDDFESNARGYAELAHMTMPDYPELDPFYACFDMGHSELDQWTGRMYLALAGNFPKGGYAQDAQDAFKKAASKRTMTGRWLSQTLIHQADAACALDDMNGFVEDLTEGYRIGAEIKSLKRLSEAGVLIGRVPSEWKRETSVQELQKAITNAIQELQKDITNTIMIAHW